ncbi:hypothetical protein GCM10023321_55880 [Pseudonocardia eucalypti]|uniref:DUF4189 domain-containing protein n=1 Tax=Pseudonocardia eucalypti TaxID=648755 RepID=A0ABP9QQ77_9PSEU|nr:hypothetical protein [Pseudonocardia eucalypti]
MQRIRQTVARTAALSLFAGAAVALTPGTAQAAVGDWAAIAISPRTGNVGWSLNAPSAGSAVGRAVSQCGASDCQAVVRVTNGCAAVAQARNRAWGWAYAGSADRAASLARSAAPGPGARVIKWVCTDISAY